MPAEKELLSAVLFLGWLSARRPIRSKRRWRNAAAEEFPGVTALREARRSDLETEKGAAKNKNSSRWPSSIVSNSLAVVRERADELATLADVVEPAGTYRISISSRGPGGGSLPRRGLS